MNPFAEILIASAVASAIAAIFAAYRNRRLYSVLKPLTTILIIGVAVASARHSGFYQIAMIAALGLCLLGDILLLDDATFLWGLVSFLFGHVCFIAGFTYENSISGGILAGAWALALLAAYGVAIYLLLSPGLQKMKLPVAFYMAAILVMSWQAITFGINIRGAAWLASAGSLLFVSSDSILAFNRFRKNFYFAELLVLSTYWTSLILMALSISAVK